MIGQVGLGSRELSLLPDFVLFCFVLKIALTCGRGKT
jgi:hypothetical protein